MIPTAPPKVGGGGNGDGVQVPHRREARRRPNGRSTGLERGADRIIAVPGKNRGCSTMRTPSFANLAQLLLCRLLFEAHQPAELDLHREVAGGKDVTPALGEEQ